MSNEAKTSGRRLVAIRLLFPGFILLALLSFFFRACFGEPYPAPFMPAFSGNGLHMISATEAEEIVLKLTVSFDDHSTAEISVGRLLGDCPPSACRLALFQIVPNPYPSEPRKIGLQMALHQWLNRVLPGGYHEPVLNTNWVFTGEVRDYLRHRLMKIYPSKTPASLTIEVDRDDFSDFDFHKATTNPAYQNTLSFREGA